VLGWNILGLVLLANIVGVAALSTPVPFRVFTEGPPNLLPSTLPWIWLPSFLVQVALGSHLVVFRMLRTRPDGLTP
jgi:membrane protease YdiL (CAAX protease family)